MINAVRTKIILKMPSEFCFVVYWVALLVSHREQALAKRKASSSLTATTISAVASGK